MERCFGISIFHHHIDSLRHYFLTYKEIPGSAKKSKIEITDIYGAEEVDLIIRLSQEDYADKYGISDLSDIFAP